MPVEIGLLSANLVIYVQRSLRACASVCACARVVFFLSFSPFWHILTLPTAYFTPTVIYRPNSTCSSKFLVSVFTIFNLPKQVDYNLQQHSARYAVSLHGSPHKCESSTSCPNLFPIKNFPLKIQIWMYTYQNFYFTEPSLERRPNLVLRFQFFPHAA